MKNLDFQALSALLQVRPPLLMLDCFQVSDDAERGSGVKVVSMEESQFQGHFPGEPVMPGVLQVAGMCQAASCLLASSGMCAAGEVPVLVGLKRVKFRSPVRPGMRVVIECSKSSVLDDGSVEYSVKNTADGQLASSGVVRLAARPLSYYDYRADGDSSPALPEGHAYTVPEVLRLVPHRYPFMFVDRAFGLDSLDDVSGLKNVTVGSRLVTASTPAHFPGYLQIEAAAQLGCAAILNQAENHGKLIFFMSIDTAEFHCPILPGQQMFSRLSCELRGRFGLSSGKLYAGGRLVTEASIKFAILSPEEASGGR